LHFADLRDSVLYRAIVCVLGFVIAALSVTGAYIWLRKLSARASTHRKRVEQLLTPRHTGKNIS
jgi:uncharacterized membrane protein YciS (DUF1049 family)